jgi:nucleotide-binding universal stress UspA family protein
MADDAATPRDLPRAGSGALPAPNALLVAVDFSPASLRALDAALAWWASGADVTVLHVIDTDLAERVERHGVCTAAEAIARQRRRAEESLGELRNRGELETMVVEGVPFVEILKIATDLACDLIVIGSRAADGDLGELLFGSTAEKVLRGAGRPVLCVP